MRLVDLFCGCGGFSLGAHEAGFDVVSAYDVDPKLTLSFARNFPDTTLNLEDVTTLTGARILASAGGRIDGIFGGPPCQGFSDIGRRAVDDPRRQLLGHFFRLVAEVEPTFFVMETRQPRRSKAREVSRSRATFRSNLLCQKPTLDLGVEALRHPACRCQKHPCTNSATRYFGNTTSGVPGRSRR